MASYNAPARFPESDTFLPANMPIEGSAPNKKNFSPGVGCSATSAGVIVHGAATGHSGVTKSIDGVE